MMDISNAQRASILVEALPYIQEYTGKIAVIKYGGNAMIDEEKKDSVMRDIVLLNLIGIKVVLVHGGGKEISGLLERLNVETRFENGYRVTDEAVLETHRKMIDIQIPLSGDETYGYTPAANLPLLSTSFLYKPIFSYFGS